MECGGLEVGGGGGTGGYRSGSQFHWIGETHLYHVEGSAGGGGLEEAFL